MVTEEPTTAVTADDFLGQFVQFETDGQTLQGKAADEADKNGNVEVDVEGDGVYAVEPADLTIVEAPTPKKVVVKKAAAKVVAKKK